MANRKNDLLEQENQTTEMPEATDTGMASSAPGMEAAAETLPAGDADESGIDLNELLGSMDQALPGDNAPEDNSLQGNPTQGESGTEEEAVPADGDASALQDGDAVSEESAPAGEPPAKPKRAPRKKKSADTQAPEPEVPNSGEAAPDIAGEATVSGVEAPPLLDAPEQEDAQPALPEMPSASAGTEVPIRSNAPVLTIRSREDVTTEEEREDIIWHEIRNAYRTRRILTGKLGGIEQTDNKKTIAIVDYKGFRIIIPLKEMMIQLLRTGTEQEYSELMLRQNKILNNMLGADMDFIVKGIDSKTFSVVASRREAMLRKRQLFYLDTDPSGAYRIYEGRIVQARVIAVAEKVIRVEVFGVETSIMARDLAWDWIGDAHERFSVGDEVLVRVQKVRREALEDIGIRVDIKSISQNTSQDNLQKCRIQSKYVGKVTDVHKGVVYIRLSNGVNAIAHSCYDYRTPGKKDDVSFAVTRLDVERGVAVGIITRIIRQNL